jgi:ubiquinone/menaquinone biosynthesis C-methylase UbiE
VQIDKTTPFDRTMSVAGDAPSGLAPVAGDAWRTPTRRVARQVARLAIRKFPRRFGLFEMLALSSIELMRRHLATINELERFRGDRPSLSVLDFGGGGGWLGKTLEMYGLADRYKVTVADIELADTPLRRPIARIVTLDPDGGIPFPDNAFDAATSNDVFEHIPAAKRAGWAAELRRVASAQVHSVPCDSADGSYRSTETDRRFYSWYLARFGEEEPWVTEHLAGVEPTLELLITLFPGATARPIVNADVWLASMIARYGSHAPLARLRFALTYLLRYRRKERRPPYKSAVVTSLVGRQ